MNGPLDIGASIKLTNGVTYDAIFVIFTNYSLGIRLPFVQSIRNEFHTDIDRYNLIFKLKETQKENKSKLGTFYHVFTKNHFEITLSVADTKVDGDENYNEKELTGCRVLFQWL